MTYQPVLSHFGIFVTDLDLMSDFYCAVFDMKVTDRGEGHTMPYTIAFLSGDPGQHHQLALATGRDSALPSTVMQISFKVTEIDDLRQARTRALEKGATNMRGLNHGNALSIYFTDPEANTVEVYLDTPWYVAQPHGDSLDLDRPDEEIWAETKRVSESDPTFMPVEEWRQKFAQR